MSDLPIDAMLRDADAAWDRYIAGPPGHNSLLGDLSCYVRALAAEVERLEREQAALIDLCVYRQWVRRPVTHARDDGRAEYDERWISHVGNIVGQDATEAEARASVREMVRGAVELQAEMEAKL